MYLLAIYNMIVIQEVLKLYFRLPFIVVYTHVRAWWTHPVFIIRYYLSWLSRNHMCCCFVCFVLFFPRLSVVLTSFSHASSPSWTSFLSDTSAPSLRAIHSLSVSTRSKCHLMGNRGRAQGCSEASSQQPLRWARECCIVGDKFWCLSSNFP